MSVKAKIIVLYMVIIFITSCSVGLIEEIHEPVEKEYQQSSNLTRFGYLESIRSINHDGHLFIVYDGKQSGNIIHHPSCECN